MKTLTKIILIVFLLSIMVYRIGTANAAVPHLINYQGRLTDSSGNPLNGSYNLTFRIYDAGNKGDGSIFQQRITIFLEYFLWKIAQRSLKNLMYPYGFCLQYSPFVSQYLLTNYGPSGLASWAEKWIKSSLDDFSNEVEKSKNKKLK